MAQPGRGVRVWLPAALCVLFAVFAAPLVWSGWLKGRGAHDQVNYHEPAVREFAREWPRPDVSDYDSATTPGYHLALAGVCRFVAEDRRALQAAGALFTLGLLWLFGREVARRAERGGDAGWAGAASLALPLACSLYVFSAGVWLLPDNAGWLGVLGVLALALRAAEGRRWWLWMAAGGLVLLGLVLVRQVHLWAAGALWASAAAWRAGGGVGAGVGVGVGVGLDVRATLRRGVVALAVTLPAFVAVAWFVRLWGGLTPPTFQAKLHGGNAAAPAFILALAGVFAGVLLPWVVPAVAGLWRAWSGAGRWAVLGAAGVGLAAALAAPTTFNIEAGRYSGLWNVVRAMDERGVVLMGRTSPLILGLAPLGAAALAGLLWRAGRAEGAVLGAAVAGFVAAQTASQDLWQRYNEPFVLMVLALLCAGRAPAWGRRAGVGSGVVLAVLLAVVTAGSLWRSRPAEVIPRELDPARGAPKGVDLVEPRGTL